METSPDVDIYVAKHWEGTLIEMVAEQTPQIAQHEDQATDYLDEDGDLPPAKREKGIDAGKITP